MITLNFAGWFQCRLSTDPDDYDDPRGQHGWTFAVAGEPDLDRVIRFQGPQAPRSHGPAVDVTVASVAVNGTPVTGHPFVGGSVELLNSSVFEGRNGLIATSAQEPIAPFDLSIVGQGVSLIARDPIDLNNLGEIVRRQPTSFSSADPSVLTEAGVGDPALYRQQRLAALNADFLSSSDPTERSALQKRISELGQGGIRLNSLNFKLTYSFELRGPHDWDDPQALTGFAPDPATTWQTEFWMGAWDADALCAYVSGALHLA